MKIKLATTIVMLLITGGAFACPVCERNRSGIFSGLTHGGGPDSRWDYLIIAVITLVVLLTLYLSVKWLVNPGENSARHIKRTILNNF